MNFNFLPVAGIKTERVLARPGNWGSLNVNKTDWSVSSVAGSCSPFTWKSATLVSRANVQAYCTSEYGIHFGLAEAHVFAHAVGEIVIHDRVGDIGVRAEIGQRIVRVESIGNDIEQRIGRGVRGQAERIPFIARPKERQHQVASRLPAPLA